VRTERLPFVAGTVHDTARLEAAVAQDCEAAPVSRVAAQRGLPAETVRRMDTRGLRRWAAERPRQPLRSLGVDEIFLGTTGKFLTVVSALETGEPLWVGLERTRETLARFFAEALPPTRRRVIRAVCVDMWARPGQPHDGGDVAAADVTPHEGLDGGAVDDEDPERGDQAAGEGRDGRHLRLLTSRS